VEFIARSRTAPTRRLPLAALLAGGAVCALVFRSANPYGHSFLPPCPIHALTGLYCPGCGSTRALYSLLHGNVGQALAMNPLLVIASPLVLLMATHLAGWRPLILDPLIRVLGNPKLWLSVLVVFGVLRNLPFAPFSALAPG
jgi:hypothetical protein